MGTSTAGDEPDHALPDGAPRRPVFIDDDDCVRAFVELLGESVTAPEPAVDDEPRLPSPPLG
jgi:hypothetical protein